MAVCLLLALTLWGGGGLMNELYVMAKIRIWPIQLKWYYLLFTVLPLVLFNWYVFWHNNKWRSIVQSIKEESSETRKKYIIVAWIVIVLVLVNLVFSIFLLKWNYERVMGKS
ncbi:hypothetical protein [Sphingobacterium sp. BIGb0165]|uniref:hypothetical protein n=1 Tax=Sphingobacterium sp. BIGb0165 TaxID=2940615 RepID=UPI00216AA07D|nr:hypothetical protein [Sphingobacterium sp. BIGb0165]MCS4226927.1 Ca2+/Na+ antiporter [Sphingobacterium sp. BIGb0165]